MFKFWEKGISPREFRKLAVRDIKRIIAIDGMIQDKQIAELKIRQAMARLDGKW